MLYFLHLRVKTCGNDIEATKLYLSAADLIGSG